MIPTADAKTTAAQLTALAEPNRLRILDVLSQGECSVSELASKVKIELVNVSHHLGVLKVAGLVSDRKKGRFIFYSLSDKYDRETKTFKFGACEVAFKKTS